LKITNTFSNLIDNFSFGFLLGVVGQFGQLNIAPQVDIKLNIFSKF
jgi:site-specific recombinase